MYYYIKGKLAAKGSNYIVIDASGIGYMVYTSLSGIENSGHIGSDITMYTYLNVREDAMELYGFITPEEKTMFMHLISVSGVGPKAALALLSVASPSKLAAAIITDNEKLLTKAAGVGPKAARRIILELKDKLDAQELGIEEDGAEENIIQSVLTDSRAEALSALMALGYSGAEAKSTLARLDASKSTEELIKDALALLMKA